MAGGTLDGISLTEVLKLAEAAEYLVFGTSGVCNALRLEEEDQAVVGGGSHGCSDHSTRTPLHLSPGSMSNHRNTLV